MLLKLSLASVALECTESVAGNVPEIVISQYGENMAFFTIFSLVNLLCFSLDANVTNGQRKPRHSHRVPTVKKNP